MKPLYLEEPVRRMMGAFLRPGAETLTRRAVEIIGPASGWSICDAGCGAGGSVSLLTEMGFKEVVGLDISPELLNQAAAAGSCRLIRGAIEKLPFPARSFDLVICECAWNLTDRVTAVREFHRVLKPGGLLSVCDIYMRNKTCPSDNGWPVNSCFRNAGSIEEVDAILTRAGFSLFRVEDHTRLLKQAAAEFVFAHGSLYDFWLSVIGDEALARSAEMSSARCMPGLFLAIGVKKNNERERRT